MRVCVCLCVCGAQQKAQGRGEKATKDDKAKEMAESGQRACLALPCLKLPSPCLCLANVKFVESWPNTFDGKDGRAQLAGDAGTSPVHPPSPLPPITLFCCPRLPLAAVGCVCVCWQVLGFLFVCHRAHFDVI